MFDTLDPDALREEINIFQIPMFAAERRDGDTPFRILGINTAHERISGFKHQDLCGKNLEDILPPEQAKQVAKHYTTCVRSRTSQRYREVLDMSEGSIMWDTTIQPISMHDGRERVLGSAVYLRHISRPQGDQLAFEDVQYFSAQAAFQLSQVSTYLDAVDRGKIEPNRMHDSIAALAGICRSIDRALMDIRSVADAQIAKAQVRREQYLLSEDAVKQLSRHPHVERSLMKLSEMFEAPPSRCASG
ncbi:PAS domain S-box protein [Profundibacterium mesophilum]|uniref:GGDEF family protein n=1 Tax=Profundibacterium mesophilum KAUST100406-0324 TaxID=1037889 RepID=A0A921NPI0_9RHOB|nr:PAS domain S-box protein [Profundibacterium mesophilum]KAF0675442.1 GGDEF family protein [Profundibacterium mesophilum KAUST100406-0324]